MYSLMHIGAVAVWLTACLILARRQQFAMARVVMVLAGAACAMFLGARLHALFFEQGVTLDQFATQPLRYLWTAGHRLPGGALLALIAIMAGALIGRLPVAQLFDVMLLPCPAAIAVARIGCWLEGCCFGKVTGAPWGVRYPFGSEAFRNHVERGLLREGFESLPVHPLPLYMIVTSVGVLLVASHVWKRKTFAGEVALVVLGLSALKSWSLEFFREDQLVAVVGYRQNFWLVLAVVTTALWLAGRMAVARRGAERNGMRAAEVSHG